MPISAAVFGIDATAIHGRPTWRKLSRSNRHVQRQGHHANSRWMVGGAGSALHSPDLSRNRELSDDLDETHHY